MAPITPFHVAVPVFDVELARSFYRDVLGCKEGRSDEQWVDFDLFGHQFVIHYKPKSESETNHHNPVDGHQVPIPHYGVVLDMATWENLAQSLKEKNIKFLIEPYIRFEGLPGEQATMFFLDPCGNALEFKAFKDINQLLSK